MASLPTVIVVPGAWHSPHHYSLLIDLLKKHGYPVVSERLPSVGSKTPLKQSVNEDVQFIRDSLLKPEIESGKEVVILVHSYGGIPGGAAAKGLSREDISKTGKKGGVIGMIYICSFAVQDKSLLQTLPGEKLSPWISQHKIPGQLEAHDSKTIFFNEVDDEQEVAKAIEGLQLQSELSFSTIATPPAWIEPFYNGRRAYIQTEKDNAIPFRGQDAMVTHSGVDWEVIKMNADHSPFLSQPKELGDHVISLIKKFTE